jgi:hypothetical protein
VGTAVNAYDGVVRFARLGEDHAEGDVIVLRLESPSEPYADLLDLLDHLHLALGPGRHSDLPQRLGLYSDWLLLPPRFRCRLVHSCGTDTSRVVSG